jgi:hypothetical protein
MVNENNRHLLEEQSKIQNSKCTLSLHAMCICAYTSNFEQQTKRHAV